MSVPLLLLRVSQRSKEKLPLDEWVPEALAQMEALLMRQEPLAMVSDVRGFPSPSFSDVSRIRKIITEVLNKVTSSWTIRNLMNLLIALFKPPFPVAAFTHEEGARAFAASHAPVVSEFVAAKKQAEANWFAEARSNEMRHVIVEHPDVFAAIMYPEVITLQPDLIGRTRAAAAAAAAPSLASVPSPGPPSTWPSYQRPPPPAALPPWDPPAAPRRTRLSSRSSSIKRATELCASSLGLRSGSRSGSRGSVEASLKRSIQRSMRGVV